MKISKLIVCIVILSLTVTLSGCKDNKQNNVNKDITKIVSSDKNLNVYCYEADTFNPIFAANNVNMNFSRICFEPLIKITENQLNETVLAQGYFISEDGLLWTVPLRNDVYWHNGDSFTANDVVATCNTIIKNSDTSKYAFNLANVEKVEAEDSYTVKFYLKTPQTNFANLLEFPIVKEDQCEVKDGFSMIGTGPFKYIGTQNKRMFFGANKDWWGNEKTDIKNITAVILPDKDTSGNSFNAKVIDVIPASIKDWSKYPSAHDKSVEYSTGDFFYLKFNTLNENLADANLRKGIIMAIDKQVIQEKALLSHGVITDTLFNPRWEFYNKDAKKYTYDYESAKNTIGSVLGDTRLYLSLITNEESEIKRNTATQIKELLSPMGIDIDIKVFGWNDYINAYYNGEYDIALCETNISPDLIPVNLLTSETLINLVSGLQMCGIDSERKEYFDKIQNVVNEEMIIVPLFYDKGVLLYNDKIKDGLSPTRTNIYNNIHLWRLDT